MTASSETPLGAPPLVSVVIPCYNAERWIAAAIQSCLDQTHRPLEVIVIDDGSTDRSLEIVKSFGDRIQWRSGPNRGGNHARNTGAGLAKGMCIQFLDADDYILPEKIAHQVEHLLRTGDDVVYGDWRYQFEKENAAPELGPVVISESKPDLLDALLSRWWVPPVAILFRREAALRFGWDETLKAAQDTDFIVALTLAGARIGYQPGCHSIYRRYGRVTVSTGNIPRWIGGHERVLEKIVAALTADGRLDRYRRGLASYYFFVAKTSYDFDRKKFRAALRSAFAIDPKFRPPESRFYNLCQRLFGFDIAERVVRLRRRFSSSPDVV